MAQITIADTTPRVQYTVGSTPTKGPHTIPFVYFEEADIKVYFNSVLKTLTTDYTITGTAVDDGFSGGTVLTQANQNGITITIERDIAIARTTDFPTSGIFNIATLNTVLDKLFAISQWLETKGLRTVQRAATSTETYSLQWPSGATTTPGIIVASSDAGIELSDVNPADLTTATAAAATSATASASSATASASSATASASSASTSSTQATLATNYAVKVNGAITSSDFSAKAWSVGGTNVTSTGSRGAAKEWATTTGAAVDTSEYSSKEYAVGSTVAAGSAKEWALGGGSSFTEGTAVAGGVFSAKKYAANAAASASVAASGQIYSTVVNQTGATLSPALSADGTYYLCDTSSNNITVTLPAIGTSEGVKYAFQKTSASNSLIFARSGSDTLNGSASNITMTDVNAQIQFVSDDNSPDNWVGVNLSQITVGTGLTKTGSVVAIDQTHLKQTIAIACGDEVTATAAATAVVTFHMPYAFTLTGIKAGVTTAPVGSVLTVDLNEAGSTCLTTKLTIDAGEKTSGTAATAAVIGGAGPALADNALMTIDVDGVGSGTAGAGLKVYLIGYAT